jgi:LPS-assembly lipoprotein
MRTFILHFGEALFWRSLIPLWTRRGPSAFLLAATALLVAGCGFHLRGQATLPFKTLYVQATPASQFALQLKRAVLAGSGTLIAVGPEQAEVVLQILNEIQEKEILSLGGGGRVREYQLRYRVQFRLTDEKNHEHIPASEIILRRDYSFSDDKALSKESEEALLYRDMRNDAVLQLVRRLQAAKLQS